jgi:predicted ribosome quality control (RQC) complex YloA/Tae2 family protein
MTLLVGKGAVENDELVKKAAANDWWIHAVGVTGSHVIVPARQFKDATEIPGHVLRAAGILALHYSKVRANKAGEVYVARKSNLRKRKGDPAGKWQVERSSSLMIRYSDDDLTALLGQRGAM